MSRLIDADALKASIPETETDIFENCHRCTTLMDYEVKDLINKQPTVAAPRWVRCEEELPDDTRDVIAVRRYGENMDKQEVLVAHLSVIMSMEHGVDKWWNKTNITHWMDFPEPPKEDA